VRPDDLLHDLDASQRRAVTSPARPLAILAPAGSGKTRVLTRRIAWRVAGESAETPHVLALTFTRKAAGELRDRLGRLGLRGGVAAGTFHGIAYAQLRALWADRRRTPPTLLTRKAPVLGEVLRGNRDLTAATLASEIEWAKARLLGPDGYVEGARAARRRTPATPERIAGHYARYEETKQQQNLVDFDDLLKLCGDALLTDETFTAAQRWRFRHLFVDEFQDVNPLQLRLLDAWRGNHFDLCVVGDPQQAIYGWNGADAGFLERFQKLYPPAEVVVLEHNYRSTPQVLSAAGHVLRRARLGSATVVATQADGPPPRVTAYATDLEEARGIARTLRDRRMPRSPWSSQAVLVRTHGQIALISEGLRAVGIPHQVRGGGALLERREVRAALDLLRRDDRPLSGCLPDIEVLAAEAAEAQRATRPAPPPDEAGGGPGTHGGFDAAAADSPAAHLAALVQLARDHLRVDRLATGAGFCTWLTATLQSEGLDLARDAVTVATFHAAKGLEWPIVHLAGLEDGFVPISHARSNNDRTEEARLLYVAMTRAITELHCSWAMLRTFKGRPVDRTVSPWLRDLSEQLAADEAREAGEAGARGRPGGPGGDWRARLAEQRTLLGQVEPVLSPQLAALVGWREEAARAARVAPTAVLDDDLLEVVAERRPADRDELAAIPGLGPLLAARVGDGLLAALHGVGTAAGPGPTANDRSG
jgi:DNA helicase-2/ATP-dependent DNA helicase PcrA